MLRTLVRAGIVLAVVVVVGLGALFATGILGIPDAGIEDNAWGDVDDERIEVVTTVWIDNPNPGLALDGVSIDYELAMNGIDLADGTQSDVAVPAGNETTTFETDLHYRNLPDWWVSHIENDEMSDLEVTIRAHADLGPLSGSPEATHDDTVETDLEELIGDALGEMEGEHRASPIDVGDGTYTETIAPTVVIEDTNAEWGDVDDEETELLLTFDVHNPNPYPLATPAFTGDLEFNEIHVAEWDAHEVEVLRGTDDAIIAPHQTERVTFVAHLDNDRVVEWFATHVDRDEESDVEMRAQLATSVNGETVTVPHDEDAIRCEYEMRTDIFVDQDSEIVREECELAPRTLSDEERESLEDIDVTETDWWNDVLDGVIDRVDDGTENDGDEADEDEDDESGEDDGEDESGEDDDDDGIGLP